MLGATLFGLVWGWLAGLLLAPARSARTLLPAALATLAAAATAFLVAGRSALPWTVAGIVLGFLLHGVWRGALRRRYA